MPGVLKLFGCDVLISPLPDVQKSSGGLLVIPNKYNKSVLRWRVILCGPGKREYRKRSKKWVTVVPECQPGDIILSRFMLDPHMNPDRRQPYHLEDGTGRVVIDCRDIVAVEEGWEDESNER